MSSLLSSGFSTWRCKGNESVSKLIKLNGAWLYHTQTCKYFISAAILITGGQGAVKSAEVFLPWRNISCQLPSLPDKKREHVQTGSLLCGGYDSSTGRSCTKWSVQSGGWVKLSVRLSVWRQYSSGWARGDRFVIMGGNSHAARKTSETVSSDGAVARSSFKMKYKIRWDFYRFCVLIRIKLCG